MDEQSVGRTVRGTNSPRDVQSEGRTVRDESSGDEKSAYRFQTKSIGLHRIDNDYFQAKGTRIATEKIVLKQREYVKCGLDCPETKIPHSYL